MLQDKLVDQFRYLAKEKLKYQDQDILNLTCGDKVLFLPIKYNMTDYSYYFLNKERNKIASILTGEDIEEAMYHGNIHFNGHKPWKNTARTLISGGNIIASHLF